MWDLNPALGDVVQWNIILLSMWYLSCVNKKYVSTLMTGVDDEHGHVRTIR